MFTTTRRVHKRARSVMYPSDTLARIPLHDTIVLHMIEYVLVIALLVVYMCCITH